jgi:flagellar basal body-associated protein FliL
MAHENAAAEHAPTPGKKKGRLRSILVFSAVAIVFGGAGFALPVFMPQLFYSQDPTHTVASTEEDAHGKTSGHAPEPKQAHGSSSSHGKEHGGGHGDAHDGGSASDLNIVPFGDVVVNLNSERFNRYLRVGISLQLDPDGAPDARDQVETFRIPMKSWLIGFLSDQTLDQIRGAMGQTHLRDQIRNHFNSVLSPDGEQPIEHILFTEFSVQ